MDIGFIKTNPIIFIYKIHTPIPPHIPPTPSSVSPLPPVLPTKTSTLHRTVAYDNFSGKFAFFLGVWYVSESRVCKKIFPEIFTFFFRGWGVFPKVGFVKKFFQKFLLKN
jgi:hypothetical protein